MNGLKKYFVLVGLIILVIVAVWFWGIPWKKEAEAPQEVAEEDVRAVVNYGHVPSISASERYDELAPLRNYLESELNIKFNIKFAGGYEEVIEKVDSGDYDLVTFGPLSYVQAAKEGIAEVVLKPVRYGSVSYRSLIFTHRDSGIDEIEDLRGRSFAFVDRDSTSGYLFPRAYLQKEGIDVGQDLSTGFSGSHTEVVMNVWLQTYDAGAIYDDARGDVGASEQVLEETKILAKTSDIPNEPWTFRKKFMEEHPELSTEIIGKMKNLNEIGAQGKDILDSLGIDSFKEASDEDYDIIREYRKYLPDEETQQ